MPDTTGGSGRSVRRCRQSAPSYGSDRTPIDVKAGQRNVASVDTYSLPFLLGLEPEDGGSADDSRPTIAFTIVDAVHPVDPEVDIVSGRGNPAARTRSS